MDLKVKDVADLYVKLWNDVDSIRSASILSQFLQNVDLPSGWFVNKKCLDVGCGSGFATWAMEEAGAMAVACDLNIEGLRAVQGRLGESKAVNNLVCGSALQLPYKSNSFDFVHCNGVLHHTENPYMGFLELVRVTRSGGTIFISLYGKGGLYNGAISVCRILSNILPYNLVASSLTRILGSRHIPNSFMPAKISVLDNMYVAIRNTYSEADIIEWFKTVGIKSQMVIRTSTTIYDHQKWINKLIHGSGYLQFRAVMP